MIKDKIFIVGAKHNAMQYSDVWELNKFQVFYVMYINIKYDSLLILYVCPLTKKWSVYNFNGRFIWTERDRITRTKNPFKKMYKLICVFMSQISIWSSINQQDFLLSGVFYTGKELRLGAHS